MVNGGYMLVKTLAALGAKRAFCVAGESYLPVLDGLLDFPHIDVVTCRHESGATFMAEAYGQLTGLPGIAMVTRGPGACNAAIGIHTAMQSSTPLIMFVGLINSADRDKEAFQEFDLRQMFGSLSKWQAVIDRADRIPEYVARAWSVAMAGRPGPVVLGLPEDVLFPETQDVPVRIFAPVHSVAFKGQIDALNDMISRAERPLLIAGGGAQWSDAACSDLLHFAKTAHLPVATSFRCQDIFDHRDKNYIGELGTSSNPALIERVKQADVILALNARLDEMTLQGYSLLQPDQKIIQVLPSAEEFGKSCIPDLAIVASIEPFISELASRFDLDGRRWSGWRDAGRLDYLDWTAIPDQRDKKWIGADMTLIFKHLQDHLPQDAMITTDAGNFSGWAQRYLRYGRPGRLLAPVSGAMGYAVPSAVAASLEHPGRIVLGLCGDGGFLMTSQELATALHHKASPKIIVCNNSMYGTIRMHQNKEYPGRISATSLTNPDFVKLGESYGCFSSLVSDAVEFPEIWRKACAYKGAALIEIRMDPAQITTRS
jgi:acetolactate synthase-1/2/3 large subunit